MPISNARRSAVCVALVASFAQGAFASDILIADAKSQPESLTAAPGGVPIKGPDGMRSANGKLIVAENASGKISVITVNGDKASVSVIMEGLNMPTGVEPAADTIWITERGAGKVVSIPMPK
jgi:hypothetical protein